MGSAREAPKGRTVRRKRFPEVADEPGDFVDCSGGSCRSCTGTFLADCVALCCCPCAVVNLLALAFLKLPWVVGRRCLRILFRKKRALHERKSRDRSGEKKNGEVATDKVAKGSEGKDGEEVDILGNGCGEGANGNSDARLEAEKLWLEWYQVGHWGFGRVSFSGIQGKDV